MFADTYLKDAYKKYEQIPDVRSRFQYTEYIYRAAIESSLILAQTLVGDGGINNGLKYGMIMGEELYDVDPSIALTILDTGLSLSPLLLFGNESQKKEFLQPFLSKEGTSLASFVTSEVGGNVNRLDPRRTARGEQTFIEKDGDHYWILNGDKIWATNVGGWSSRDPQLMCVLCRTNDKPTPQSPLSMVIVYLSGSVGS